MVWGPSPHDTRGRGREARDEQGMRPRPRRPSRCPSAGDLQGERTESGRGYGGSNELRCRAARPHGYRMVPPVTAGYAVHALHEPHPGLARGRTAGRGRPVRQGQAWGQPRGLQRVTDTPAGVRPQRGARPARGRHGRVTRIQHGGAKPFHRAGATADRAGPVTRCLWRVKSHLRCPKPGVERGAQGEGAPGAIKVAVLAPGTVTGARGSSGARQRTSPRQHFTSVRHT